MARYIDADKVLKHFSRTSCVDDIIDYLEEEPTADVVEVCRCKECANGYHKTDISVMCKIWGRLMITEDYCSYGAKMEGDAYGGE